MDAKTRRNAVAARDHAVARVGRLTWRIGTFAVAGAAVLGAGFAHLLPTHLPHLNAGSSSGSGSSSDSSGSAGTDNGSSNSDNGNGFQGPGSVPGQSDGGGSHVTSGGS